MSFHYAEPACALGHFLGRPIEELADQDETKSVYPVLRARSARKDNNARGAESRLDQCRPTELAGQRRILAMHVLGEINVTFNPKYLPTQDVGRNM
jgi:hypothetical protein